MGTVRTVTLASATLAMGLTAGLFCAYAHSVLPGLRQTDDRAFIGSMQQINVAILNGWFLVPYVGALVLTGPAAGLHLRPGGQRVLPWVAVALLLYLVLFGITAAVNVPLNDQLLAAGAPDRIADPAAVRAAFEARWVRWNIVRAVLSTASFGLLTVAVVLQGRLAAP